MFDPAPATAIGVNSGRVLLVAMPASAVRRMSGGGIQSGLVRGEGER